MQSVTVSPAGLSAVFRCSRAAADGRVQFKKRKRESLSGKAVTVEPDTIVNAESAVVSFVFLF